MTTKALLEGCIKGVGKLHMTSIFPCGIFQCMKGVNRKPGDPNYDLFRLALKSTAQRIYPNYANVDWSVQTSWVEFDRNMKQTIIDNLSKEDYDKLVFRLEQNPELKDVLGLDLIES